MKCLIWANGGCKNVSSSVVGASRKQLGKSRGVRAAPRLGQYLCQ